MKKTVLSLLVGLSISANAMADDLLQVYQQAIENDPVVNRAKADRDAAFEGISISRANLLPQLSANIGYTMATRDDTNPEFTDVVDEQGNPVLDENGDQVQVFSGFQVFENETETLSMGANLSMSLYDHANWLGLDRAELVAQQSEANYSAELQRLITRTVSAYLAVLRAKDNVEFVRAEKRAIERQLEQTKQRFEVGLTAITDVHEAQANFDNTVAQEIRAENQLELRLEELREITGKYHDKLYVLDTEKFSAPRPSPDSAREWLEIAEESNLDLLVQRFAKDIAMEDVDIATSGHYPTLSLNGSYGRTDTTVVGGGAGGSDLDIPALNNQSIGIRLDVPIYQGGSVSARTDQARYRYVAASETLELTYRQTVRSVRSSYNDVIASISTIRAFEQAVVSAQSALEATEAGFKVGTRTIVDVLNSTRNLFDARRNLAGARYDFIQAIVSLKQAAGTLTRSDVESINRALSPEAAE
ncbi:outer membrane channel protein TolC [Alteromonas sp. ASW11-36]|uniref:Outer membrane channel protein TolC n=1 Tax=Alteromonas arenosi TaxID=3055817 RepID=A0ABT7SZS6_9ALTE|nr:outer membrane channel protein TolC [Alteromonas sp. ASW11-36]MDM7861696.1 outer membrane channel protein TolC [Alteromonas sp. ASW11-36]